MKYSVKILQKVRSIKFGNKTNTQIKQEGG